jgi:hypothetical protein
MIPDTFFFVCVKVNSEDYLYGPYLNLNDAIEILVDIAPSIGALIAKGKKYSYQAVIEERILHNDKDSNNLWKVISTPLSEEKAYLKKI